MFDDYDRGLDLVAESNSPKRSRSGPGTELASIAEMEGLGSGQIEGRPKISPKYETKLTEISETIDVSLGRAPQECGAALRLSSVIVFVCFGFLSEVE